LLKSLIDRKNKYAESYKQAGREDLASQMQEEILEIQSILPAQITDSEIKQAVTRILSGLKQDEIAGRNKVMGMLMNNFQGKNIDGSRASEIVNTILNNTV